MRVFVTGATGFVGSAVVQDLIKNNHEVVGLARNEAAATKLKAAGAEVHMGDLENLESLKSGAAKTDGVIHTGFIHDFTKFAEMCAVDKRAIETLANVLKGSDRPLIVTSGTAMVRPGHVATEVDVPPPAKPNWPRASEETAFGFLSNGVRAMTVRLSPSVHGDGDHAFIPILIGIAREKGVAAYIDDGANRWTAVHRHDTGSLYRLAFEKGSAGDSFHGVAEESISMRDIATMIGKKLGLPVVSKTREDAAAHFGWFTHFAGIDCPASSALTRQRLGWKFDGPTLLQDLEKGTYFKV